MLKKPPYFNFHAFCSVQTILVVWHIIHFVHGLLVFVLRYLSPQFTCLQSWFCCIYFSSMFCWISYVILLVDYLTLVITAYAYLYLYIICLPSSRMKTDFISSLLKMMKKISVFVFFLFARGISSHLMSVQLLMNVLHELLANVQISTHHLIHLAVLEVVWLIK